MISLLVALVVLGVVLWLVSQIPMEPVILNIIRVICIVLAVLYVLRNSGGARSVTALP